MRKMVESWVTAERELYGNNLSRAVKALNETIGANIAPSRVSEWCKGKYVPSPAALSEMLYRTLPWALKQAGAPDALPALRALLWTFEVEGGQQVREILMAHGMRD